MNKQPFSKNQLFLFSLIQVVGILFSHSLRADVNVSSLFGDHMVLQRDRANRIWGKAEPGEEITLTIADQNLSTTAEESGRWQVELEPLAAGGPYEIAIAGKNKLTLSDVLVGEVWLCSGQSNMELNVGTADDADLELLTATHPEIRMITVPHVGTQEPQDDFEGEWQPCTPASVKEFSAVGYYFGKELSEVLDVPIGLIDDSWGGSACEAWVSRASLAENERFAPLLDYWTKLEATYNYEQKLEEHKQKFQQWQENDKKGPEPRKPENLMTSKNRPGNLYCGSLHPLIGYGMRGVIWYQGEANASRAYQYRDLFPLMIQTWREDWKIGDFPFYWVQLADYMRESPEPAESDWAELREAQTMALDKLPNVGQAVITDLGESVDIHPLNKRDVALRLARWALARDYGIDVIHQSPRYREMEVQGKRIVITFDVGKHDAGQLDLFDTKTVIGFTIAGEDKKFVHARAKIVGRDKVEVWSEKVSQPVAVRYAWASNPVCNLQNRVGLPATSFRTDEWPGITEGKETPGFK